MSYTLKFERRFSMAHRLLSGKSPKCSIPHGHNEYIRVSLVSIKDTSLSKHDNMVANFADVKNCWHKFIDDKLDHCLQLSSKDPLIGYFKTNEIEQLKRILVCPGDPTTEILCACLMSKLDKLLINLNSPLRCIELEIQETPTNTVILTGLKAYEDHLPDGNFWWGRSDQSINEF